MKRVGLGGLLTIIAVLGMAGPAMADSWWSSKTEKHAAQVTIAAQVTDAGDGIKIHADYNTSYTVRRLQNQQKTIYDRDIKAIQIFVDGTSRKVVSLTPASTGHMDVFIPMGDVAPSQHGQKLKIQAKIYTDSLQSANDKSHNKPTATSDIVELRLPNNQISWTPTNLNISGMAGAQTAVTVSFKLKTKLTKAHLHISPDWVNLSNADIAGKTDLDADVTYTLPLTVTIPRDKSHTYKGSVKLQAADNFRAELPFTITATKPTADFIPDGMSSPAPSQIATDLQGKRYVRGQLLVGLTYPMDNADQRIKVIAHQTGAVIVGATPKSNTYLLSFDVSGLSQLMNKQADVSKLADVDFASPNYVVTSAATPNDSLYPDGSWNSTSSGEPSNWGQKYIKAPAAWDITTGSINTKIGVIDRDFADEHIDIINNIAHVEQAGPDDGSTGYHGSHVAGIICGYGNNHIGIAGINWRCSLSTFSLGTNGTAAVVEDMMMKAADNGVKIVNLSLSGSSACAPGGGLTAAQRKLSDGYYARGMRYATLNKKDVLWVFAAGNNCADSKEISPTELVKTFPDNMITVGAINQDGTKRADSNYGENVTVGAPGDRILSTYCWPTFGRKCPAGNYVESGATSAAAPFISGVAGLVSTAHPEFTAKQLKQCIVNAATIPVPNQSFKVVNAADAVTCKPPKADPCVYGGGNPQTCESTNATVTMRATSTGDISGCNYSIHVIWGDGTTSDHPLIGSSSDAVTVYATHTYQKPGTYQINATAQLTSGFLCPSPAPANETFTLLLKSTP